MAKSGTSTGPYGVGDPITYSIVVANTGNVTLTNVTVSDLDATIGVCAPVQPGSLAPSGSMTCPAAYVVTQAELDNGQLHQHRDGRTATGTGPDRTARRSTFTQSPSLNVTKSETSTGPYAVGDTITYSIVVANTGNVTLTNVTVSDLEATMGVCTPVQPAALAPSGSMSCAATYVVAQRKPGCRQHHEHGDGGQRRRARDTAAETVTFTQSPSLNVTKSETSTGPYAVGTRSRTTSW